MVRYSILLWFIYLCVYVCVRAVFCGSASNILLLFLTLVTEVCAVVFIYCVVNVFNKLVCVVNVFHKQWFVW